MDEYIRLSNIQANFQKICRTCLLEKDNLRGIFGIVDLLKECTSIQIDMTDDLPKLICVECINKLNTAFEFRKQCDVSQKILLQLREFGVPPVKLEDDANDIDIKSEDSYNINDDNFDTCDESNKLKTNSEFSYMNVKPLSNVEGFTETTTSDDKNILDSAKKNINLESTKTKTGKNSLPSDVKKKPSKKKLKTENSDLINDDDDWDDIPKIKKTKGKGVKNAKSTKKPTKQKVKKKVEVKEEEKKDDDTPETGLPCPKCKRRFELEPDLELHMLKHQKFEYFICPKCSKSFRTEKSLKQHFDTHMINKPYKCTVCDQRFSMSGDRNRHIVRIHTGETPYVCASCGKRFADSSKLARHMKYHLNIRKFECTVCSKRFMSSSEHRIHMRKHTGEKPYLCTECGKGFSHADNYKIHKLKHTGERPFPCTECDKSFLSKTHLKSHMLSHTGEKPFVCEICNMGFGRKHNMIIHVRTHTGERPYSCDICDKTFISNKNIAAHKRTHHKEKEEKIPIYLGYNKLTY
ncbi:zinc finger protein 583-like [Chrysoperla carnea]|uniref:zinc finger protein 583-like n=1 Tax=Chrysoperla carnea TaxID=189513 RepID=UPI001D08CEA5|nr:zinc finger protein 583-like [Chrysoperla carnea]